ncbi:LytR/AlgR family response regulator transcription factor [Pedobacter jejuensis]|uniref:DNA-binding response regulator n=1 Tax=Pedobacter jejuensis TaxID=1268550 RepID=A0A3N0BS11_9SPHI|nr:LytTR family DNA-binding domain-containing protein [Pedobacter jejuensis]RNL51856.1 DNA-binding response regulator [Pedobacter jejuensis]
MNSKLKCYIIDDEERAINSLEFLLDYYCNDLTDVVGSSSIYQDALIYLEKNKPDILFLDINLGTETGFDLLKTLGALPNTNIIIVTAYSEFALEAFSYETVNYLLKPVDPEALQKTINRIHSKKAGLSTADKPKVEAEQLFYPSKNGYTRLNYKDIICVKGDGSYVNIYLADTTLITASKNLSFFQQLLSSREEFIRVHKSYIINRLHIKQLNKQGGIKLIMQSDMQIPVSQAMKDMVMDIIGY